MPTETTFIQLPCGARAFRMEARGVLSMEDARTVIRQLEPGGVLYGLPAVILAPHLDSISSDARAALAAHGQARPREHWLAVVMTNPLLRVTANFILRVQRATKAKLFPTEPEALQWLDAKVRERQG